jgi:hypothetical protein
VNLQGYKALLLVVTAVLALLVASPALERVLVYSQTEFFSAMWLLGPEGQAENLPSNLKSGASYNVYLGIENQLGSCAYYSVQVKFRNLTQSAPDPFNRTASSLPPLYSFTSFVADKETLTLPLTFSFDYTYILNPNSSLSKVTFDDLMFNGLPLNLRGYPTAWDAERNGFTGNLFFELWIYNDTTGGFQYHQRYTSLQLNMTV